ncbi:MAG: hypothetical protein WC662_01190 [Candidatus Paceibacterota bacterium]|jgi:hypothetical protein
MDTASIMDNIVAPPPGFNTTFQEVAQTVTNPVSVKEKIQPFLTFLNILSVLFIAVIAYTFIRLLEIRRKEHHHLEHEIEEYAHHQREREQKAWDRGAGPKNEKWESVLQHLFSHSAGDWKLAILEADVMLEGLMNYLGVPGADLGEKLKNADKEKFQNIGLAWEVHVIRNKIAHEGSDFEISQYEAKRVIALYEQIFREFGYLEI